MAFIYDLSDTWNNAGISFNGIKLNATDTASAAGSKLIDLQINGASKFTVGKTGAVIATGLIESTVGGFRFPDGTTQTTKATVNSVSGTGTVNGITLTGSVTDSGSLTLGGTLGNIANNQLTNSAITINGTSTPLGGSIAVGTVTSVAGTGTVSGLSLTGSVTTSGSLTLGGTLVLTSGQVTDGLGYTPYNATNPAGYTTNVGTVTSVAGTGTVNGLTLTGSVTTSGSLTLGGTLGNIANSQLTNSAITINGTSTALGGSISVGTVTSVAALTLGTSGTDLASSVANGTTTPVVTLNVPTASAANRGALSSADWSTFNAKQAALVSGTNIKTVGGASLLGSGDVGTIGLAYGGTGATTESGARTALGLGTAAVLNAGVAGGVATLDGSGTVPTSQLPGAVLGGLNYQGTWNASTNTPTLASSTGSKGYYYVVSTAGSTNLDGITDWKIGDWAVYDGSTWQKVDNTDAVSSVNGYTGAVVLTTSDVAQGTNLYFTQAAARASVSAGTGISYNSTTGVITNSAPDQTVALTGAGTTTVTGTYPNFTITSNDSTVGTVTSVAASGGTTGLTFTGSPITTAGTLTLGGTLAVANGGTGATTLTSGYVLKGNGTSAVSASVLYDDGTNTGIGTTSPSALFHISQNGGGDIGALVSQTNGGNGTTARYRATHGSGAAFNLQAGNGHVDLNVTSNHHLTFGTNNAERMRITATGDIGIGTTTPNAKLNVSGGNITISASGTYSEPAVNAGVLAYDGVNGEFTISARSNGGSTYTRFMTSNGGTGAERMRILSGGNVGVGTSSPATKFVVSNGGAGGLEFDTNGLMQSYNRSTSAYQFMYLDAAQILFRPSGTERMRLDGSGVLLINRSSTSGLGKLNVDGGADFTGGNVYLARDTGNVGIGTASPTAGYKLDVSGSANASGSFVSGGGTTSQAAIGNKTLSFYNTGAGDGLIKSDDDTSSFTSIALNKTQVKLFTSNTERMRIDSAGVVGIGTTTPGVYPYGGLLNVAGGISMALGSRLGWGITDGFTLNGVGTAHYGFTYGGSTNLVTTSGYYGVNFATLGSERMRITSGGDVGIGTTTPSGKLHVNGTAAALAIETRITNTSATGFTTVTFGDGNTTFGQVWAGNASYGSFGGAASMNYSANSGPHVWYTNYTERMRIDSSGNLLVGTTSVSGRLTVVGNSTEMFTFTAATTASGYGQFKNSSGTTYAILGNGGGGAVSGGAVTDFAIRAEANMLFATGNTERMRIDSSGNIGINTSSPGSRLDVLAGNSVTAAFTNDSFAASPTLIVWNKDATSGRLIGFRSTSSFTAVGTIETNGTTTTYGTSSDVRLKHDIVDAPDAASLIDAIQVRSFKWNADNSEQRYGMVAQELVTVAPEAVQVPEDPEDMMGVDYSKLVPMLVKEIQSMRLRLAQLEGN
jgi:hypothetical protein